MLGRGYVSEATALDVTNANPATPGSSRKAAFKPADAMDGVTGRWLL